MTSTIAVEGNLTAEPKFNVTNTGKAVANLRIAVSSRRKGRDGEYFDSPPLFYDVAIWGPSAENVAESLHTGDRVLVTGSSYLESYRDAAGDLRSKHVLDADAIGVSLRYVTAVPVKPTRQAPHAVED